MSTLDGVLEVRNEHFWTVGFGSLVCDRVRLFGSNGKGQRPTPVLLLASSVWPVATDVLVALWFSLSPGSALKVKANFKVEPQTC